MSLFCEYPVAILIKLIHCSKKSVALHKLSDNGFRSLDSRTTAILQQLKSGNDSTVKLLHTRNDSHQQLDRKFSGLEDTVRIRSNSIVSKVDDLAQKVLDMARPNLKEAFLDSLFFPQFRQRETDVSDPCTTTFEWFFDPNGGAAPSNTRSRNSTPGSWQSFPRWLENADSSQQYWLSGKAGSGKSTLMAQVLRNQARTARHLKQWSGSKHLCILSFFLFRAGSQLQVGFVYLLRSLLYQLVDQVPALQEVLMARFLPSGSTTRIAEWPVSTLQKMLSFAIDIADDCKFLVLIDGIDEFQSYEPLGDGCATAVDLLNFLYDIQKPAHVKLCVSSRPELCIADRFQSILETELSKLNHDDIRIFVHERMSRFLGLEHRDSLSQTICNRADGIFMWTVFALREMEEGYCFKETYSQLMTRLDGMGPSLETAIAHMLQGIARPHKTTVAFYLQALGSWGAVGPSPARDNMSVALMAVSRTDTKTLSTRELVDLCRQEQQDLRKFTRGLVEVSTGRDHPTSRAKHLLVKPEHESQIGVSAQSSAPSRSCNKQPWTAVPNEGSQSELADWCATSITLIHRSAHDFFFPGANAIHCNSAELLKRWNDVTEVPRALQRGLWELLCREPIAVQRVVPLRDARIEAELVLRYRAILHYTASAPLTQHERTTSVDNLLSALRQELLAIRAGTPSKAEREHVPGDIFSRKTLNGRLQPIDGHNPSDAHAKVNHNDMLLLAVHESEFWIECSRHTTMDVYLHDRLRHLHQYQSGHLVLATMAQKSGMLATEHLRVVLESINSWTKQSVYRQRPTTFPGLSWLNRSRPDSCTAASKSVENVRLSETDWLLGRANPTCFQWTPRWRIEDGEFLEEGLLTTMMKQLFVPPGPRSQTFETVSSAINPWNIWLTVVFEREPDAHPTSYSASTTNQFCQTRLFVSLNAACDLSLNSKSSHLSSSRPTEIFQVARIAEEDDGSAKVLYRHILRSPLHIRPHTEFWKMLNPSVIATPSTELWELLSYPLQALEQSVIDIIIADVRSSTQLNRSQIGAMVEGVRRWPSCQYFD